MTLEKNSKTTPTASETIKNQQDEIRTLKQKLAEKDETIRLMVEAEEKASDNTYKASLRTSFTLPKDWSDLEKLYLAFKVMEADNSLQRQDTFDDRDEIFSNIWEALQQAILVAPVKTQEDILIKLDIMDFFSTAHLKDSEGRIALSKINWLELEAHAINKQLKDLLQKLYLPEQKARLEYIAQKNSELKKQASNMTNTDKLELAKSLNTLDSYSI